MTINRKRIHFLLLALILLAVSAYLYQASTAKSSQEIQHTTVTQHPDHDDHDQEHHHHDEDNQAQTVWNLQKAENLRQRMMIYRPDNQGHFKEYWVGSSLNWQNIPLPDRTVSNTKQQNPLTVVIDGSEALLNYSQTGEQTGWNIVSVFSNQDDKQAKQKHTYFFIIKNGQETQVIEPISTDGQTIHFSTNVDHQLLTTFTGIVNQENQKSSP